MLEKRLHVFLTHAYQWDWKDYEKYSNFTVKRCNLNNRLSAIYYPIAYNFDNSPNWREKCARLPWPIHPKNVATSQKKQKTVMKIKKHANFKFKAFHNI